MTETTTEHKCGKSDIFIVYLLFHYYVLVVQLCITIKPVPAAFTVFHFWDHYEIEFINDYWVYKRRGLKGWWNLLFPSHSANSTTLKKGEGEMRTVESGRERERTGGKTHHLHTQTRHSSADRSREKKPQHKSHWITAEQAPHLRKHQNSLHLPYCFFVPFPAASCSLRPLLLCSRSEYLSETLQPKTWNEVLSVWTWCVIQTGKCSRSGGQSLWGEQWLSSPC